MLKRLRKIMAPFVVALMLLQLVSPMITASAQDIPAATPVVDNPETTDEGTPATDEQLPEEEGPSISPAAAVPNAITSLTMTDASGDGVLDYWESATVSGTWEVPNGTPSTSTFTLTLPAELDYYGSTTFDLKNTNGDTVGSASVSGKNVVFTLGTYVDSNPNNIKGTFFFSTSTVKSLVTWGDEHTFTFTGDLTGSPVSQTLTTGPIPNYDPPGEPGKGGWWNRLDETDTSTVNALTFRIVSGKLTSDVDPLVITDTAGTGWTFNCDNAYYLVGDTWNNFGDLTGATRTDLSDTECSSTSINVSISDLSEGQGVELYVGGDVTDTSLKSYSNNQASVSLNGTSNAVSTTVNRQDQGGTGDADPIVMPAMPTVTAGSCTGGTDWTAPKVEIADGNGLTYQVDLDTDTGDYTITATKSDTQEWDITNPAWPSAWTKPATAGAATATLTGHVDPGKCAPQTKVVPVAPTVRAGACDENGERGPGTVVPATTTGVTYTNGVADNGIVSIDAEITGDNLVWGDMLDGWMVIDATHATYSGTYIEEPCETPSTEVVPVTPEISIGVCDENGVREVTVTPSALPAGVTYSNPTASNGTYTIDAEITGDNLVWGDMPDGWMVVDATHATFSGTYTEVPCDKLVIPQMPDVTQAVCTGGELVDPVVIPATTPGVTYTIVGDVKSGAVIGIVATVQDGYAWDTASPSWPSDWIVDEEDGSRATTELRLDNVECTPATPVAPTITGNVCTGGAYVPPTVVFESTTGVTYSDGVAAAGQLTATATLMDGYVWVDPLPTGWTVDAGNPAVAHYVGSYTEAPCAPVIPVVPFVEQAVCTGGELVQPTITIGASDHIVYVIDGDIVSGGTVTVTATLDDGYAWDEESMPAGWVIDEENPAVATLIIELDDVQCTPAMPVAPTITGNVCTGGAYVPPTVEFEDMEEGITYSDIKAEGGVITATATVADGYAWADELAEGWTVDAENPAVAHYEGTYVEAPCTPVVPVNPEVTKAVCEGEKVVDPSVKVPTTPGIKYTTEGEAKAGGKMTVTATLEEGYEWGELPEGWTKVNPTTATYEITFAGITCEKPVTPPVVNELPKTGSGVSASNSMLLIAGLGVFALAAVGVTLRTREQKN